MKRVALISTEPIGRKMGGIGLKYLEFARRLPALGFDVVLLSPTRPEEMPESTLGKTNFRTAAVGNLAQSLVDCDCAVVQGQLANHVLTEVPGLPTAVDLSDPYLVENLSYLDSLGLGPYRNDHASWVLQMSRGDFFLCSSEEQRLFYLGFLTGVGRVNPVRSARDADFQSLIAVVPFGVDSELPPYKPLLPRRSKGEKRLLFGALYDWYDPWTLLRSLDSLDRPQWRLYFVSVPHPSHTPQALLAKLRDWCRHKGWWRNRVQLIDWVPADRRYDLLRDVDVLVAPHCTTVESRLSFRTRYLEALAAGCPVISSDGGTMSQYLREFQAGLVLPPGDVEALSNALLEVLEVRAGRRRRSQGASQLVKLFAWDRVLQPLVAFCSRSESDPTKRDFAFRPTTQPTVSLRFLKDHLKQHGDEQSR